MNEFEAARAARIADNARRMEALGVQQAAAAVKELAQRHKKAPRAPRPWAPRPAVPAEATRASSRIRGRPADDTQVDLDALESAASKRSKASSKGSSSTRDGDGPRFELTDAVYAAPFTLPSCGVTVWELGKIYRGPFAKNYYSSKASLYRHAIPVGYRASKEAFGRVWDMSITAGEAGPVFTVSEQQGRRSFTGSTPTAPWTEVCLALKPTQRISGPLFFGFSDVHLQRALAALYMPDELAFAQYGTRLPPGAAAPSQQQQPQQGQEQQQGQQEQLAVAERLAEQLQALQGVGAPTAQALALTTALGGSRHTSLEGLASWLLANVAHQQQLQAFLLTSEEVPRCSRQLPSWRAKWVPLILQQLTQQQPQQQQQQVQPSTA